MTGCSLTSRQAEAEQASVMPCGVPAGFGGPALHRLRYFPVQGIMVASDGGLQRLCNPVGVQQGWLDGLLTCGAARHPPPRLLRQVLHTVEELFQRGWLLTCCAPRRLRQVLRTVDELFKRGTSDDFLFIFLVRLGRLLVALPDVPLGTCSHGRAQPSGLLSWRFELEQAGAGKPCLVG